MTHLQKTVRDWEHFVKQFSNSQEEEEEEETASFSPSKKAENCGLISNETRYNNIDSNNTEAELNKIKRIVEENKVRLLQTNENLKDTNTMVISTIRKEIDERITPCLDRVEMLIRMQREEDQLRRKQEEERREQDDEWRRRLEEKISERERDKSINPLPALRYTWILSFMLFVWPMAAKSLWSLLVTSQGTRAIKWLFSLLEIFLSAHPTRGFKMQAASLALNERW